MVVVVVFFSSRTPPDEDLMKALTILHPGSFYSHYAQPQQKDPKPELMAKPSSVCTLSFYSWHKALKEVCKAFSFVYMSPKIASLLPSPFDQEPERTFKRGIERERAGREREMHRPPG